MTNGQILKNAYREPEIFEVKNGIKRWLQTMRTLQKKGYDYRKRDIIRLEELNKYPTGDTILWDDTKGRFVVGKKARDIYYPTPPPVFTCSQCGATFTTQGELDEHIATVHPPPPPLLKELFFGRLTADQTIQGPDGENLLINVADVDTLSGFSAGANRYVIQHSGYFSLISQMWIDGGVELGGYQVFIRINGAARNHPCTHKDCWMGGWDWWRATGKGGDLSPRAIWTPKHLNKNDYVQAYAWGRPYSYNVQGTEPYCGHKTYLSVVELMRD